MITNHFNKMGWIREKAGKLRREMAAKWDIPSSSIKVHFYWKEWSDGDEKHRGPLMWGVCFYYDHENIHILGGEVKHSLSDVVMNVEVTPELVETLQEELDQVRRTLRDMRR